MQHRPEEAAWITAARNGDDIAFGNLVEAYQVPVYNLCYRMLGTPGDAEDAAQETFLKAYRHLKRYDPKRSFTNWLLSIASHHCIDRLRRRRIKWLSLEGEEVGPLAEQGLSPEGSAVAGEQQASIKALLEELSPTDRSAVVLKYWYDMSYEEIAETLSLTQSAVKSRLHRARRELAEHWVAVQPAAAVGGLRDEASAI